ncbi:unnamed protein product [Periconia digitata]|uniref:Uncharacterized protein n=1 Tax=Periconia digitata TaxID=1303443 RepID=A0A9W4UKJ5_9PLEO|nr:unnamed protein product [Periconia digitata]
MSLTPVAIRATRTVFRRQTCPACKLRLLPPGRGYAARPKPKFRITRDQQEAMSPAELRLYVDERQRKEHFIQMVQSKAIDISARVSNQIIKDFLEARENQVDSATNVQDLAEKHRLNVADISALAMTLLLIPIIKDPSGRLPPEQNRPIAKDLLVACSAAKDTFATLQILSASYLSNEYGLSKAEELARICSVTDFIQCRMTLDQLAQEGDGNCLAMQGLLLEEQGRKGEAKYSYRKALEVFNFTIHKNWPHPGGLPWIPPWRSLANLLLSEPDPTEEARKEARAALEKGATKGDDPLAYWQLASFEVGPTPFWLRCMSKAAASGHIEAAYNLGRYYLDASQQPDFIPQNKGIMAMLNFATTWKDDSLERLAREWLSIAAQAGHKPAMSELAELHAEDGDEELAREYLHRVMEPPPAGKTEEWPQLVINARSRMADLKNRSRKSAV